MTVNFSSIESMIPDSQLPFVWDVAAVIKTVIFTAVTLCTSLGNLVVLLAVIFRKKDLHLSTHRLIANLAFADFLVGSIVMPTLASYTITGRWYFGHPLCEIWTCFHFWLCSASILSITAICLDRFVGVQYPLHHHRMMNMKKVIMISAVVWTLAGFLSIIPLVAWPEPVRPGDDDFVCRVNFQLGHVIVVSVFIFYIPLCIMLALYWKIYRIAMEHFERIREGYKQCPVSMNTETMRVHGGSHSGNSSSFSSTNSTTASGAKNDSQSSNSSETLERASEEIIGETEQDLVAVNYQRQSKTSKKVLIIVGAFILCYFPFFTAFLVKGLYEESISLEALIMMAWLRYFNSCLNPFIYPIMLKPFRKAMLAMFRETMSFFVDSASP